ncbi:MAG: 16S rRNA (cytosine(1402)-N(4))-methyltransferase RsmH [Epsilonproteobacteria bacterium]|nr:16S rRNA (cytosine(1402)-N(4))-methyltransferase RsmH [Campylobacterota bacterium]
MQRPHTPVLLEEVLKTFQNFKGYFTDCTLGYAGHSEQLLKKNKDLKLIGIDRDEEAIEFSKKVLKPFQDRVIFIKSNFADAIEEVLKTYPVKGILADLGVSSLQLDSPKRGFGFESEKLDMRMDQKSNSLTAYDVINYYDENRLSEIFYNYGEIPQAKKLAKAILKARPITTPAEFKKVVEQTLPKNRRLSPATLAFQAVRIEVNRELEELKKLLDSLERYKPKGAKVAIITFHSLEDRVVKERFRKWSKGCICPPEAFKCECGGDNQLGKLLTKKPIIASSKEVELNPRSRSAKMRIFEFKE